MTTQFIQCFHKHISSLIIFIGIFASADAQITFDIEGATSTYVTGINSATDVCGYATFPGGAVKGFILKDGDTTVIQAFGYNTWFGGMNDDGLIVGRFNELGGSFDYQVFVYNSNTAQYVYITDLDNFENTMPNDINNEGWISGDLKDGVQRRIFTYHPDNGLATNFKTLAGVPKPTYGGHQIDADGNTTAYWIDGIQQKSTYYITSTSSFEGEISTEDAGIEGAPIYKTNIKGVIGNRALLYFVQSGTTFTYDLEFNIIDEKLRIPNAQTVYADEWNNEGYIAGNYIDAQGVTHGFFQAKRSISFSPDVDGWNFANSSEDCWTFGNYGDISYESDPYWLEAHGEEIPFPTTTDGQPFSNTTAITWAEWVEAYGEEAFYDHDPNVNHVEQNSNALWVWDAKKYTEFAGACWGMSAHAALVYHDVDEYYEEYPSTLGILEPETPATANAGYNYFNHIPAARVGQTKQFSQAGVEQKSRGHFSAFEELGNIFNGLNNTNYPTKTLSIIIPGEGEHGFHSIVPYRLERDPSGINYYNLYVYDPNDPLNTNQKIEIIYTDTTSWHGYTFGGNNNPLMRVGLRSDDSYSVFSQPLQLMSYNGIYGSRDGECFVNLFNHPDVVIEDGMGGSILAQDGLTTNTIEGSQTLYSYTGRIEKPSEFALIAGEYDITVTSTENQPFKAWYTDGIGSISLQRDNAQQGDVDQLTCNGSVFSYVNEDNSTEEIDARILTSDATTSYQYFVDNINVSNGQTIGLNIIDATHIMITSNGAATNYDVRIRIYNPETGFWEAMASNVPIGSNVTQLIIPSLTDDNMDGIIIETDANQDGTFEDSEAFDNEGIPNMMLSLSQINAPNEASEQSFHVSNVGGGNLNWNVISSPSWITINTGVTGVNHGPIEFTVMENTLTEGRQDYIIVEASSPANDLDTVLVVQGEGGGVGLDRIKLSDALVTMMPNPAQEAVQFVVEQSNAGNASYSIYTATGQLVREAQMRGQKELVNTSEMPRGVYQVRFIVNGQTVVKKLVLS